MKKKKQDRRVKTTKLILKNTLLELMKNDPISKISVKRLCDEADINRSTFYSHYENQFELLQQMEQEVITDLSKYISEINYNDQSEVTVQLMRQMLEYIAKKRELFQVLLSENGDFAFHRDMMLIAQHKIITELSNDQLISQNISEYVQRFVITGSLSILQKWLENDLKESPTEMAQLITNLLYHGLSSKYLEL